MEGHQQQTKPVAISLKCPECKATGVFHVDPTREVAKGLLGCLGCEATLAVQAIRRFDLKVIPVAFETVAPISARAPVGPPVQKVLPINGAAEPKITDYVLPEVEAAALLGLSKSCFGYRRKVGLTTPRVHMMKGRFRYYLLEDLEAWEKTYRKWAKKK